MVLQPTPTAASPFSLPKSESERTRRARGIHQFTYTFCRSAASSNLYDIAGESLLSGHLGIGDAVAISIEPDLISLSRGFILDLSPDEVIVGVDHEIKPSTIQARLRTRRSVREARAKGGNTELVFRIDKDELSGGMGRIRENLAQLFYAGGDTERLRLIVDLEAPRFDDPADTSPLLAKTHANRLCRSLLSAMNKSQVNAIERALCAQDYALILGMPGTGKTTVVAALIRILAEMGKTVLLTSYTHSAVDTILRKLKGASFGVLRVGNPDKASSSSTWAYETRY